VPDPVQRNFTPGRLNFARRRKGYSQLQLAAKLGVSNRAIIAYEGGEYPPGPEVLSLLESVLDFPLEFYSGDNLEPLTPFEVSFRSLTKMTAAQRDMTLAQGELAIHLSNWLEKKFELPSPDLLDLSFESDPEAAAETVRAHWHIGQLPIRNMIHSLESKGVRVFSLSVQSPEVDAISSWKGNRPFVFLNTFKSAERSRFDAAHELGHLVMHKHGGPQGRRAESQANAFASAFLMPRGSVLANAPRFATVKELVRLKKIWGVSLAALNFRLHELKLISDWHYRSLAVEIAKNGYRVSEPEEQERESSLILPMLLSDLHKNEGLSRGRIAESLCMNQEVLDSVLFSLVMTGVSGGRKTSPGYNGTDNPGLTRVK
jgi:Zn-dependent peptidase ImmA (M78 family)/DNA-binding XRE family transcriptional regulator